MSSKHHKAYSLHPYLNQIQGSQTMVAVTLGMLNQEGTGAFSILVDENTIKILKSSGDRVSDLRGLK